MVRNSSYSASPHSIGVPDARTPFGRSNTDPVRWSTRRMGMMGSVNAMWENRGALADGREIIYYDERPDTGRARYPDRRDLGESSTASELRYDPIAGEWVAIASQRQSRTYHPPANQCPLCPSRDGMQTEIPAPDYDVVAFENRFPSFAATVGTHTPQTDDPLFGRRPGRGRCEVVCFTSEHDGSFASLTPQRVRTVLAVWADRTRELSELDAVEQVFPFENRGEEIGVTLAHPHGQIYGYPIVTPRTSAALRTALEHRQRTGRNLYDDVLAAERAVGTRVVAANAHWTAFVPTAARWPYEVHLYPNERVPDLPSLPDEAAADFADIYLRVLRAFDALFDGRTPYIAGWHQAPVHAGRDLLAAHLEVFTIRRAADKLKYLAGSESGMAVWINDIPPETAARRLRDAADAAR